MMEAAEMKLMGLRAYNQFALLYADDLLEQTGLSVADGEEYVSAKNRIKRLIDHEIKNTFLQGHLEGLSYKLSTE